MPALRPLVRAYGLARSLKMYWANPWQLARMRRFYAQFILPGDLCFDIGAHVGSRSWVFARLGASVVAVEPQPVCQGFLGWLFRGNPAVTLVEAAVGAAAGRAELIVSSATPTVSTASAGFLEAVASVPSFAWVRWDERVAVPMLTLDDLIRHHGRPRFVKIDVEGLEPEVLDGLSTALPALSFEFIPAHKQAIRRCLARLRQLGDYRFNISLGESMALEWVSWAGPEEAMAWLLARPADGPSGDVYARLVERD